MSLPVGGRARRSIRMPAFDYAAGGVFFVTICTAERACLFGDVVDRQMRLNAMGQLVADRWRAIGEHRRYVELDTFVVMPNHVHGILRVSAVVGATLASPSPRHDTVERSAPNGPDRRSLGAIVGAFKADTARRINRDRPTSRTPVWQRNYYEHLVRSDAKLERIRQYIASNPALWASDRENPGRMLERSSCTDEGEAWDV